VVFSGLVKDVPAFRQLVCVCVRACVCVCVCVCMYVRLWITRTTRIVHVPSCPGTQRPLVRVA
jgi:hypothetical protein